MLFFKKVLKLAEPKLVVKQPTAEELVYEHAKNMFNEVLWREERRGTVRVLVRNNDPIIIHDDNHIIAVYDDGVTHNRKRAKNTMTPVITYDRLSDKALSELAIAKAIAKDKFGIKVSKVM